VTELLNELRRSLAGEVIGPEDGEYDAPLLQRLRRPPSGVIARCAGAADVATALDFTRSSGLEIAVRGGGPFARGAVSVIAGG
jgi:hypothetical protein